MFGNYVYEQSAAAYTNRILLMDADRLEASTNYTACFERHGFRIVHYTDDLSFRIEEEENWKGNDGKIAVIASPGRYIPYDIQKRGKTYWVTKKNLFPT